MPVLPTAAYAHSTARDTGSVLGDEPGTTKAQQVLGFRTDFSDQMVAGAGFEPATFGL